MRLFAAMPCASRNVPSRLASSTTISRSTHGGIPATTLRMDRSALYAGITTPMLRPRYMTVAGRPGSGRSRPDQRPEIADRFSQALFQIHRGTPAQHPPRQRDIGLALDRIIARQRAVHERRPRARHVDDLLSQLKNRKFGGVAQVEDR